MPKDLVNRLRKFTTRGVIDIHILFTEAADEIERLRGQVRDLGGDPDPRINITRIFEFPTKRSDK